MSRTISEAAPAEPALDWQGIDTVLLDMDGTLLDLHFDTTFWQEYLPERYAAHHCLDLDAARAVIVEHMRATHPRLDYYCFDWWARTTGLDIVGLKPDLAHLIRYRPGAEAFLAALRASGRATIIVTNSHPEGVRVKHGVTGIRDRVDAVHCAHDHAHPKEHEGFWHGLATRLDFDPARTLLVDDNLNVLERAAAFGIAHLRAVRRPDSSRPPLEDLPWPSTDTFEEMLPPSRSRP